MEEEDDFWDASDVKTKAINFEDDEVKLKPLCK